MLPNTAISQQIARSIQLKESKKRQTKTKQERKAKEIAFSKYATPLSFNFTDKILFRFGMVKIYKIFQNI